MTVYVVESGEYSQRCVTHVAASLDAACRAVRDGYASHGSVVVWDEPKQCSWSVSMWTLDGRILEQCGHRQKDPIRIRYDITMWPLIQ